SGRGGRAGGSGGPACRTGSAVRTGRARGGAGASGRPGRTRPLHVRGGLVGRHRELVAFVAVRVAFVAVRALRRTGEAPQSEPDRDGAREEHRRLLAGEAADVVQQLVAALLAQRPGNVPQLLGKV